MTHRVRRPHPVRKRVLIALFAVVLLTLTGFLAWCGDVAVATPTALGAVRADADIRFSQTGSAVVLTPTAGATGTGLLFVPGAKVAADAYAYKLAGLVHAGITVVIPKPFLNLAFFDPRPASSFTGLAPDVDHWFVGGHSLGGVRACQFASDPGVAGLVLLGSYCANDLSGTGLRVLSIGGQNDGLSTPQKIADAADDLPADAAFLELPGVNHASFGDYGPQAGDGTSTVPSADVAAELTSLITAFATRP
ncbi:MAG: alpha/beta hydrolase [Burkholderiaceae bacterium]|nr:alpha/beta hydrolase [Microbacteriaceae bacterium]